MPQTVTPIQAAPAQVDPLRHEHFCLPAQGETAPRIEGYIYYTDSPVSGRSEPTHDVRRCLECGATHYTARS